MKRTMHSHISPICGVSSSLNLNFDIGQSTLSQFSFSVHKDCATINYSSSHCHNHGHKTPTKVNENVNVGNHSGGNIPISDTWGLLFLILQTWHFLKIFLTAALMFRIQNFHLTLSMTVSKSTWLTSWW